MVELETKAKIRKIVICILHEYKLKLDYKVSLKILVLRMDMNVVNRRDGIVKKKKLLVCKTQERR